MLNNYEAEGFFIELLYGDGEMQYDLNPTDLLAKEEVQLPKRFRGLFETKPSFFPKFTFWPKACVLYTTLRALLFPFCQEADGLWFTTWSYYITTHAALVVPSNPSYVTSTLFESVLPFCGNKWF